MSGGSTPPREAALSRGAQPSSLIRKRGEKRGGDKTASRAG